MGWGHAFGCTWRSDPSRLALTNVLNDEMSLSHPSQHFLCIPPDSANSSLQLNFPNHTTWAQWRASGQDAHGRMADPMFADAANANFTLLPSSPAFSLGIQQIDLSFGVGPRSEDTGMAQPVRLLPVGHAG